MLASDDKQNRLKLQVPSRFWPRLPKIGPFILNLENWPTKMVKTGQLGYLPKRNGQWPFSSGHSDQNIWSYWSSYRKLVTGPLLQEKLCYEIKRKIKH
jgi:hypothetical protein